MLILAKASNHSMVSVRIVIVVGLAFLYFAIGFGWLYMTSGGGGYEFNVFALAGHVGPYVNGGHLPANNSIDGQVWIVLLPQLTKGSLAAAEWAFPVSLVFAIVTLSRWKFMLVSGAAGILSGVLWIYGISTARDAIVGGLNSWYGYNGRPVTSSVDTLLGAYIPIVGGAILVLGFVLTYFDKLGTPD
jgi:hypothetical protein